MGILSAPGDPLQEHRLVLAVEKALRRAGRVPAGVPGPDANDLVRYVLELLCGIEVV